MSGSTRIEWTASTWNPVTGCTKVSPGCDRCYAATFAERWRGIPGHHFERGFDLTLRPERLALPPRWTKPRLIFVNSMSDLFHTDVPDSFIGSVFDVMASTSRHTYQVLTKRPGRMRSLLRRWEAAGWTWQRHDGARCRPLDGPPPNVWLGVSAEDQRWADIRIPLLLDTPAACRFVSAEPLLGPLSLHRYLREGWPTSEARRAFPADRARWPGETGLDWVIAGGESGPGARSMQPQWARDLRDQCEAAGTAFFFKQWGGRTPKAGGRELDGRTWGQIPARFAA